MRSAPLPIGETLEAAIEQASPRGRRLLAVFGRWRDMVSPATLEHACPTSISHDVLRLTVTDSLWMSELTYFLPSFLAAFNEMLPEGQKLSAIRLRLGPVTARGRGVSAGGGGRAATPAPADTSRLSAGMRERLERIADPELRDLVVRVAATLEARKR